MADTTRNAPQVIGPQSDGPIDAKKQGRKLEPGSAFTAMGKIVRNWATEKLLKPQKPHGGIR